MICKTCNNPLLKISTKCYDNFEIEYNNSNIVNANDLGFIYDGKNFEIKYCLNCGKVDGNYPVKFNYQYEQIIEKTTPALIQEFYDFVMADKPKDADAILRKLSIRLSPTDCSQLYEFWGKYESIKTIQPFYPEFKEYVDWMISR